MLLFDVLFGSMEKYIPIGNSKFGNEFPIFPHPFLYDSKIISKRFPRKTTSRRKALPPPHQADIWRRPGETLQGAFHRFTDPAGVAEGRDE